MTLIIDPGAGYAQVTDTDGTVVMDTRDELFHILSKVNGSVTRPQYSSAVGAVRSADIDLGAVDPNCTAVLGLARITYSGGADDDLQLPSGLWYAVGGTIVFQFKSWQSQIEGAYGDYVANLGLLSFVLSGGRARMQEELSMRSNATVSVAAYTVTYRLFCGTFT